MRHNRPDSYLCRMDIHFYPKPGEAYGTAEVEDIRCNTLKKAVRKAHALGGELLASPDVNFIGLTIWDEETPRYKTLYKEGDERKHAPMDSSEYGVFTARDQFGFRAFIPDELR